MIGKINQEVRGVPYCWGCHGSLAQFANRVEHGALAGNVCTRNDPRPDVVGVDCSSFVSAAWGLPTHFTTLAIRRSRRRSVPESFGPATPSTRRARTSCCFWALPPTARSR